MSRYDDPSAEEFIGPRDLTDWRSMTGRALARQALRATRWAAPRWALIITLALGVVLAVGFTVASAEIYESVTEGDWLAGLDQPVLDLAVSWRTPASGTVATWFTDVGGPVGMPILAALGAAVVAFRWRTRTPVVLVVAAAAGSLAMTAAGKHLIGRARPPRSLAVPPYESSASFPSGHTLNATVVVGVLVYLALQHLDSARSRIATIAGGAAFVVSMGLSRVYLGHHWLTDVVVGWSLGLAWLVCVVTAHRLYLTAKRSRGRAVEAGRRDGAKP